MRILELSLLTIAIVAIAGCSQNPSGSQEVGGGEPRQRRVEWLASASNSELTDALDDPSPNVRSASHDALEQKVGAGITFRPYDPPEKRAAAVATYRRLQDLANEHGEQYFIDLVPVLLDRMENEDSEIRKQAWHDVRQLTGITRPFRVDDSPMERQETVEYYRDLWAKWQSPKSRILEFKRHPEKLREHKRQWAEDIKRRRVTATSG